MYLTTSASRVRIRTRAKMRTRVSARAEACCGWNIDVRVKIQPACVRPRACAGPGRAGGCTPARGRRPAPVELDRKGVRLSCEEAIDLMSDALVDELSPGHRRAFIRHLRHCEGCHDAYLALDLYLCLYGMGKDA